MNHEKGNEKNFVIYYKKIYINISKLIYEKILIFVFSK